MQGYDLVKKFGTESSILENVVSSLQNPSGNVSIKDYWK